MSAHYNLVVLGAGPGGYVAAIRAAQLGLSVAVVEEKYWGGVCWQRGLHPVEGSAPQRRVGEHLRHPGDGVRNLGERPTFDFGAAFDRSRKVADGRVKGVHFLMKKNKITEYDGRGSFDDSHSLTVAKSDGTAEQLTFDNAIIATGSTVRLLPGVTLSDNVVTYESQILDPRAAEVDRHRRRRRHRHGIRLHPAQLRRRDHHHRVPRPGSSERRRRRVQGDRASSTRSSGVTLLTSTKVESIVDNGSSVTVSYTAKDRRAGVDRGRQGHDVDRFRTARRGVRTRQDGRAADRARSDRDRRPHAHQRSEHLRHRRRHGQAAARPRRRGAGRRGRRDDGRRRDPVARRLPQHAAGDVLPAAGRELRPHRAAGARRGAPTCSSRRSR